MPPKNKSKRWVALAALLVLWLVPVTVPSTAHAYQFYTDNDVIDACPDIDGLTKRLVVCIKETFVSAVNQILYPFSAWLANTIAAACLLAVLIWGYMVAGGKASAPWKDTLVLFAKIGAVMLFTTYFGEAVFDPGGGNGGLFGILLDCIQSMLTLVTNAASIGITGSPGSACHAFAGTMGADASGNSPTSNPSLLIWDYVDCSVENLIGGVSSQAALTSGLIGFFVSSLFSGAIGAFIAIMGFILIIQFLFALARAMYIFLTSYMALSLMIIVSPLFIPLILFESTKGYFEKWVKTTIGFMLQPIFLFAYLNMLLWALDDVIYSNNQSLAKILASDTLCDSDDVDCMQSLGQTLSNRDFYGNSQRIAQAINFDPTTAAKTFAGSHEKIETGILGTLAQQINKQPSDASGSDASSSWSPSPSPSTSGGDSSSPSDPNAGECGNLSQGYHSVTDPSLWNNSTKTVFSAVMEPANYFEIDTPVTAVDWIAMANRNGYDGCTASGPHSLTDYLVQVVLSMIMAVVTAYIFLTLLDYLPFIGSGISGDVLNMPTFGEGPLAPPTSKLQSKLNAKLGMGNGGGG